MDALKCWKASQSKGAQKASPKMPCAGAKFPVSRFFLKNPFKSKDATLMREWLPPYTLSSERQFGVSDPTLPRPWNHP